MPLATLHVGTFQGKQSEIFTIEKVNGFNYGNFVHFYIQTRIGSSQSRSKITKEYLRHLSLLGQRNRERQCIQYAIFKALWMSSSTARRINVFQNTQLLSREVKIALLRPRPYGRILKTLLVNRIEHTWIATGFVAVTAVMKSQALSNLCAKALHSWNIFPITSH